MAYAIMRAKKLANIGSVAASMQHCYRERETHNADKERTPDNQHLGAKNTDEAMGKLRALLPEKRRKDAVLAVEYVMTASPEWFAKATPVRIPRHLDTQPTIIWTLVPCSLGHLIHVHLDRQSERSDAGLHC